MAKVIGLAQSKGGVGKTTTALNLAAELARRGRSSVILDADPAGHAVAVAEDGHLAFPVAAHLLETAEDGAVTSLVRPDILIVPSRIDRRTGAGRDVVAKLAALTQPVAPAIAYRAVVADSLATGEAMPEDSPSGREFAALADAVLIRLGDTE